MLGFAAATGAAFAATIAPADATPNRDRVIAEGNRPSSAPDVSRTGRYVVFCSDATNLVRGDTNGKRDIFLRDTVAKTTRLVSKGVGGIPANGSSFGPNVTDDGRYVTFTSAASNMVAGDTNNVGDAFRVDMSTGKTVRLSVTSTGGQANKATKAVRMSSANGGAFVLASDATNLVSGDTNGMTDVFYRFISSSAITRLSKVANGTGQTRGVSSFPSISADGSYVGWLTKESTSDIAGTDAFQYSLLSKSTKVVQYGRWYEYDVVATVATNRGIGYTISAYGDTYYYDSPGGSIHLSAPQPGDLVFDLNPASTLAAYAASWEDPYIQLYNSTTGETIVSSAVGKEISLSGNGRYVAFTDQIPTVGQVRLWDTTTGTFTVISVSS